VLTSPDPNLRREAIQMCKDGLDAAAELKAVDVLLWPGQDGYDHPFQVDYLRPSDVRPQHRTLAGHGRQIAGE